MYIELTKQIELIKLEEFKDAPIINIREEAGIPIQKAGPKRSIYLILIFLITVTISFALTILKNDIIYYSKLVGEMILKK